MFASPMEKRVVSAAGPASNNCQNLSDKLHHVYSAGLQFAAPDPVLRTNESEVVRGVLQMMQGLSGGLFFWDHRLQRFSLKHGIYVSHLSPKSFGAMLGHFLYGATCLQLVENFIKKVESFSTKAPPTVKAFTQSVSLWLKRLRDVALKEEAKLVGPGTNQILTLLGLRSALSSVCSGAENLFQVVQGAVPAVYLDIPSEVPPAEIAVHILDHLYKKLDEVCPVQGGEEEAYHMLLVLFLGSLFPYVEVLDCWLYDGILDDPFEEMFFFANNEIAIDQPAYWEKSYLLRIYGSRKLGRGNSSFSGVRESLTNDKKDMGDKVPALASGFVKGKDQNNIDALTCPSFMKDIAKSIVSAGKSLQLIRHAKGSHKITTREGNDSDCGHFEALDRSPLHSLGFLHYVSFNSDDNDQYSGMLALPEIFCISLSALIGDGLYIYKHIEKEDPSNSDRAQLHNSRYEPMKLENGSYSALRPSSDWAKVWYRFLIETISQKTGRLVHPERERANLKPKIDDSDCCVELKEANQVTGTHSRRVFANNCNEEVDAVICRSFWPENPAISTCRKFLSRSKSACEQFNLFRTFSLPPLNDENLRGNIFCENDDKTCEKMKESGKGGTNYTFGFQFDKVEFAHRQNERKALKNLFPFPTLLPYFQEDVSISDVLPFQKSSTLSSKVLKWIESSELKTTTLPGIIVQECLIAYIKKQVNCVGKLILLQLTNGWRLMDELGVLRSIYLLGSGDLLQHFLTVVFNKLDKGEPWDDEFELNTILQESIRNSADGMLLSAPDSLVVSVVKPELPDDVKHANNLLVGLHKGRTGCFAIDALDTMKFTYKVSWPLELIANVDATKKYNQVTSFLLKVKRAKFVLDKARRWMWKDGSAKQGNRKRHMLLEQKLLHFVDAFHQYVMDRVFHSAWLELCEGMASAGSLDEVMEVHEAYLMSIQRLCFVAPDKLWALIANRIKGILGLALEFYSIQQLLCSSAATPAIKASCESEVDRIEKQFDDCIIFLLRVLSFKLNVGHFPHLADLVTRINYNYFYMSDNGSVLTGSSSDTNASKLGKTFLTRHDS